MWKIGIHSVQYDEFGNVIAPLSERWLVNYLSNVVQSEGGKRISDKDGFARWAPPKPHIEAVQ